MLADEAVPIELDAIVFAPEVSPLGAPPAC
jgi:hypothetical protein